MHETKDGYVFETFKDGKAIFYKESYKIHCEYHDVIRGMAGREEIQDALIYPDLITQYTERKKSGKIIAHCKKYRKILRKTNTNRGSDLEYWEIIIKKAPKKRRKIVTAYIASSLEYAMINDRIEEIVYKKRK